VVPEWRGHLSEILARVIPSSIVYLNCRGGETARAFRIYAG